MSYLSVSALSPTKAGRKRLVPWLIAGGLLLAVLLRIVYLVEVAEVRRYADFVASFFSSLQLGSLYALIALGYTMVYGIIRLINFAHGEVFMVGAFSAYLVFAQTPMGFVPALLTAGLIAAGSVYALSLWRGGVRDPVALGGGLLVLAGMTFALTAAELSWVVAIVCSMLITGLLGITIDRIAYRPLRGAPRISLLITAIAVSIFLQNFGLLAFTANQTPFRPATMWTNGLQFPAFDGTVFTTMMIILVPLLTGVLVVALNLFVNRTRLGKAMRAAAQDPEVAQMMGVNVNRVIATTFFLGSVLAAAAAVLYGMTFGNLLVPAVFGLLPGIKAFAAAVIGGIGSLPGAVLGGVLIGFMENFFPSLFPRTADFPGITEYKDTFAFLLMIVVLLVRPSGIIGEDLSEKV